MSLSTRRTTRVVLLTISWTAAIGFGAVAFVRGDSWSYTMTGAMLLIGLGNAYALWHSRGNSTTDSEEQRNPAG
jgi:hypothetical protein